MSATLRIVIVGAGMVGLTLAALLSRAGSSRKMHVSVVDAVAPPAFDPHDDVALRVSALSAGSVGVLQSVAAWKRIRDTRACPYREMRVWDAAHSADGPDALHFDAAEHALPELGFIVENVLVQSSLHEIVSTGDVDLHFGQQIESLTLANGRPVLGLQSGTSLDADLVIGADGARSRVREAAGIPVSGWNYAQKAFVTHVRTEKPHAHTAWQ
ncbi:MAG: FAD-dependent monooxygenase, partial [Gammaproteobacteria bacterium]|nr:FAD-dependent monooxygenase [Gammaproteobacteria bacterium]